MDYIDLRLGDFLNNIVMMSTVIVYDNTYNELFLFQAKVDSSHNIHMEDSSLSEGEDLNNYGVVYVSSTARGLEIGVVEV